MCAALSENISVPLGTISSFQLCGGHWNGSQHEEHSLKDLSCLADQHFAERFALAQPGGLLQAEGTDIRPDLSGGPADPGAHCEGWPDTDGSLSLWSEIGGFL